MYIIIHFKGKTSLLFSRNQPKVFNVSCIPMPLKISLLGRFWKTALMKFNYHFLMCQGFQRIWLITVNPQRLFSWANRRCLQGQQMSPSLLSKATHLPKMVIMVNPQALIWSPPCAKNHSSFPTLYFCPVREQPGERERRNR